MHVYASERVILRRQGYLLQSVNAFLKRLFWEVEQNSGNKLPGGVAWGDVSCYWRIGAPDAVVAQIGPSCWRLKPQQLASTQSGRRPKWKSLKSDGKWAVDKSIVVIPEGEPTGEYWLYPPPPVIGTSTGHVHGTTRSFELRGTVACAHTQMHSRSHGPHTQVSLRCLCTMVAHLAEASLDLIDDPSIQVLMRWLQQSCSF